MWPWIWLILFAVVLAFELFAIRRPQEGDTLSETIWHLQSRGAWGKFVRWMLAAFLAWLLVHFASGGKWA